MERLLEVVETANILGVKHTTLYVWIHRGVGPPHIKLPSGAIRFRRDALEKWVASLERAPRRSNRMQAIVDN